MEFHFGDKVKVVKLTNQYIDKSYIGQCGIVTEAFEDNGVEVRMETQINGSYYNIFGREELEKV